MFSSLQKLHFIPFVLGLSVSVISGLVFLMYIFDSYKAKLEVMNVIAQLVVAISALLAFVNYFESKKQRQVKEAINLVSFFREEVITLHAVISSLIKKDKGENFVCTRITSFDILEIESFYTNRLNKAEFENLSSISNNPKVHDSQIALLNKLEEFALCVYLFGLESNEALLTVRAAFIELVEVHVYVISLQRTIGTSPTLYNQTLRLYSKWQLLVDRLTPQQRLDIVLKNVSKLKKL